MCSVHCMTMKLSKWILKFAFIRSCMHACVLCWCCGWCCRCRCRCCWIELKMSMARNVSAPKCFFFSLQFIADASNWISDDTFHTQQTCRHTHTVHIFYRVAFSVSFQKLSCNVQLKQCTCDCVAHMFVCIFVFAESVRVV